MLQYLVLLSIPLGVYGVAAYIKDTIIGRVRPNKVTWLMWSIAPLIATFAAISKGVTLAVIPVFLAGFGPFCVLIASFFSKKSYWRLETFDYFCGFCSVLALILWFITKEANVAIVFSIISDGFAAVPTLKKAWTNPETESVVPYLMGLLGAIVTFAAIKYWIFSEYAFASYLIFIDICLIFSIYGRKLVARLTRVNLK